MYTYMYIVTMAFILYKDKEHYLKKKFGYLQFVYEIHMCVCSQKKKNKNITFFAISDRHELLLI